MIKVQDIVRPNNSHTKLRSGCSSYPQAVVMSVNPFILVSEGTDMMWNHLNIDDFEMVGTASNHTFNSCMRRMNT